MKTEDSNSLLRAAQNGDVLALETFFAQNEGLVWSIVHKFKGRGHELDDLFQVGSFGLLKAIKRFELHHGVRFSTYAVPYILGEIKRYVRDNMSIKVSRSTKELYFKIQKLLETSEYMTLHELSDKLHVSLEKIIYAMDAYKRPISLNETGQNQEETEKLALLKDPKDRIGEVLSSVTLKEAVSGLSEREQSIISLRYMKDHTQESVAKKLGISQVQVSRLEKKILLKLREQLQIGSES